jgi:hypothetical protein
MQTSRGQHRTPIRTLWPAGQDVPRQFDLLTRKADLVIVTFPRGGEDAGSTLVFQVDHPSKPAGGLFSVMVPDHILLRPCQHLDRFASAESPGDPGSVVPIGAHQIGKEFGVGSTLTNQSVRDLASRSTNASAAHDAHRPAAQEQRPPNKHR